MTTRGERLRGYLLAKTGGAPGWQKRLVEKSGVKRQTISKWTSPEFDRYPDLETLSAIAAALEAPLAEVIGAMEDQPVVVLTDPRAKDALRSLLEELLDERDRRPPAGTPPG